jgi:hydrogenase expression/formation protein HypD
MEDNPIDAFIAPGHVSCIIGAEGWRAIPNDHRKPTVVAGFEPLDILLALEVILRQLEDGRPELTNVYTRVVREEGNVKALELMDRAFEVADCTWRGIGVIPASGLFLRDSYGSLDARKRHGIRLDPVPEEDVPPGCACGEILLGKKYPPDCPLFGTRCTPRTPVGPCMVSGEGTCLIWHKFRGSGGKGG